MLSHANIRLKFLFFSNIYLHSSWKYRYTAKERGAAGTKHDVTNEKKKVLIVEFQGKNKMIRYIGLKSKFPSNWVFKYSANFYFSILYWQSFLMKPVFFFLTHFPAFCDMREKYHYFSLLFERFW